MPSAPPPSRRPRRPRRPDAFDDGIVPVMVKKKKEMVEFKVDEFPRAGTTVESLGKLKGAFPVGPEGVEDEIVHTFEPTQVHADDAHKHVQRVTAGQAAGINDGAAAIVLASNGGRGEVRPQAHGQAGELGPRRRDPRSWVSAPCPPAVRP